MSGYDVGDWVVGGFGQDADYGFILGKDHEDQFVVSWYGSMTRTILATGSACDVFSRREDAYEEFMFRLIAG